MMGLPVAVNSGTNGKGTGVELEKCFGINAALARVTPYDNRIAGNFLILTKAPRANVQ